MPEADELDPEDYSDVIGQAPRSRQQVLRLASNIFGIILALGALGIAVATYMQYLPWGRTYTTDWVLVALLCGTGPYAWTRSRDLKRIEQIDEHFPDFIRDLAEGARSGLTIPKATVSTAKGSYGALTPEIRRMAAQVQWGVDFPDALTRFSKRNPTPLIERTVSLILEAKRSGGAMTDVLSAAAQDARELRLIIQGRSSQLSSYGFVIYTIFLVFIGIILILQAQFIPAFQAAVQAVQESQNAPGSNAELIPPDLGGLQFQEFDPVLFHTLFFHASILQGILGGFMGGVLTRGSAMSWLKHSLIMLVIAWLAFRSVGGV